TELVIDCRMLLVSRLQSSISPVRSHCGIGIGRADFLVFAGLPAASLGLDFLVSSILAQHILHMMLDQTVPAHIGADQRSIDVHDFRRGDLRLQAVLDRSFEDFTEALLAPTLADARQT